MQVTRVADLFAPPAASRSFFFFFVARVGPDGEPGPEKPTMTQHAVPAHCGCRHPPVMVRYIASVHGPQAVYTVRASCRVRTRDNESRDPMPVKYGE